VRGRHISLSLGAIVSVLSLVAVVVWVLRQDAPTLPSTAGGFSWLGASLALSAVTLTLRGWRWHRVMRVAGVDHRAADAYALTAVAYMGNNVLPARGGELLKVGILGTRSTSRRREILGSVIAERLFDAGALAVLFVVLTWAGVDDAPTGRAAAYVVAGALVAAAAGFAAYVWLRRRGRFERFATLVRPVASASKVFIHPAGLTIGVLSLVIWMFEGLNLVFIARSIGLHLTLLEGVLTTVLASLAAAIPAAPGYAGTFDAGLLLGLKAAGAAGGAAVGVLLLARFMFFVPVTIAGLVLLVVRYGGLHLRERRAQLRAADLSP
jgi:uncharacterized membrane protein YbhN (UPF0104 family)